MQDKIIQILNSDNIEQEINNLSFLEKVKLVTEDLYAIDILFKVLKRNKIKLLNEEETISFLENYFAEKYKSISVFDLEEIADLFSFPYVKDFSYSKYHIISYLKNALILTKNPQELLNFPKLDKLYIPYELVPDEILEERILKYKDSLSVIDEIVMAFKNDEYKIKYLNKVSLDYKAKIVASMSYDNRKKCLSSLLYDKDVVISTLNDSDINAYLNKYKLVLTDEQKANIIVSFSSLDYIKQNIGLIKTDKGKIKIIKKLYASTELLETVCNLALDLRHEKNISDCIMFFIHENDYKELVNQLVSKIKNKKYIIDILPYININDNIELFKPFLKKIKQKEFKKISLEIFNDLNCPYRLLEYIDDKNYVLEILKHSFIKGKYKDDMFFIFQIFAEKYNLNLNHLIELAKALDCSILGKVENENIVQAINLDDDSFRKYLNLLNENNLVFGPSAMSSILNSFLNRRFSITYPDKVSIFTNTLNAAANDDINYVVSAINEVLSKIDITKYNITDQELVNGVMAGNEKIIDLYNKMTYEYLNIERNNYVNSNSLELLPNITKPRYEINELVKQIIHIKPIYMIMDDLNALLNKESKMLTSDEIYILNNKDILKQLVQFKKESNYNLDPNLRKYLKPFTNILKICYHNVQPHKDSGYDINLSYVSNVKVDYDYPDVYFPNVVEILSYIDVNKLKKFIFSNPQMEKELNSYLKKYGILAWDCFNMRSLENDMDIELSYSVLGSLISNFSYIMNAKQEKEQTGERFGLITDLALASYIDSDALIYPCLFKNDNYKYIASNPRPNTSPLSKQERLKEAIKCLKIMHERNYITVPPVNEDFELSSGKRINICLGNTNDPINLTYGERTKACMRIGGAGKTLFNFCLENENGFHISFNHPDTGEFISRVSCYRNGNTLFMNQLRFSTNKEYSNDMIKEACELIAQKIIELTKDSNYPIKNVLASDGFAFSDTATVHINCSNPKAGFEQDFYSDVHSNVVVVATAKNNKELLPIELGPDKSVKYEVGRSPIRKYISNDASIAVAHIEVLDSYLSGVSIDEIKIDKKAVLFAYVGEDWYVALTTDGQIINYIQKNSKNNSKANCEMEKYLVILQEHINDFDIENSDEKEQVL